MGGKGNVEQGRMESTEVTTLAPVTCLPEMQFHAHIYNVTVETYPMVLAIQRSCEYASQSHLSCWPTSESFPFTLHA